MPTPEDCDSRTTKLHLKYGILILVLILIAVMTDKWTGRDNFTEYLTNAATMVTLVLALVAIVYSFIANDGLSKSLGNIGVVAEEVRKSKEAIGEFLKETHQATSKGEENKNALETISKALETNLSSLQQALNAVAAQTEALPGRFDKLETTFSEAAKNLGVKTANAENSAAYSPWSETAVKLFCTRIPLIGNLLVYACILSKNTNKKLSLAEFDTASGISLQNYHAGLLTGLYAVQLISRKLLSPRVYQITKVDAELEKIAKTYFMEYVTDNYTEGSEERIKWIKSITGVEAFFGVKG